MTNWVILISVVAYNLVKIGVDLKAKIDEFISRQKAVEIQFNISQSIWLMDDLQPSMYERARQDLEKKIDALNEAFYKYSRSLIDQATFDQLTNSSQALIMQLLQKETNATIPVTTPVTTTQPINGSFKLPQIELPTFSGEGRQWDNFWSLYNTIVHQRSDINNVVKFNFLLTALKGEPAEIAKTLPVTEYNYELVIQSLKNKYE